MNIIEEGNIKGIFNGFKDSTTIFEMQSGSKWQQAEYKYIYYYGYMPKAKIIEEAGNFYIKIENIDDKVLVKRI